MESEIFFKRKFLSATMLSHGHSLANDPSPKLYRELLKELPENHEIIDAIKFNLSWYEMREGSLLEGFQHYIENGRNLGVIIKPKNVYPKPQLQKTDEILGKTILLSCECGAGDELITSRYVRLLKNRGAARIIWVSRHGLEKVLSRIDGIDLAITPDQVNGVDYDFWLLTLELPLILEPNLKDIKAGNYISANDEYIEKWHKKLKDPKKFKVGVRWSGDRKRDKDRNRSIPFHLIENLSQISDIDFYSLQTDEAVKDISPHSRIIDWGPQLSSWEDTAGAIANLDLVISSCTSVAHLAAGMGIETWIPCRPHAYYTWSSCNSEGRSNWYTNAKAFFEPSSDENWPVAIPEIRKNLISKVKSDVFKKTVFSASFGNVSLQFEVHEKSELVSDIIRHNNSYTKRDLCLISSILKKGDTFVDLGANIGWYTLFGALCVGSSGKVIAVEPEPENFSLLVKNVVINNLSQVELIQAAVSDEEGMDWLWKSESNYGDHALIQQGHPHQLGRERVSIKKIQMNSIFLDHNPKLIKMDIQGFEPKALDGCKEFFTKHRPPILMEFSPGLIMRAGGSPFEIFSFIEKNKYIPIIVPDEYSPKNQLEFASIETLLNFTRENRNTEVGWDLLLMQQQDLETIPLDFRRI